MPAREISPAIDAEQPVRERMLPYGHHEVTEEDIRAVLEVLRSDWITTGPKREEFEEAFAAYVGARWAVSFSSGTAALHAAAFASGLEPGAEAITTPLTFCATANCVLYVGAHPVFADVEPDTLTLDPDRVRDAVTPRTRVLLPVHYAGHPADLATLLEIAERHGLVVIEDACHALGAEYRGERIGHFSHMTAFSFHPVKHITTGEGGMVSTDDPDLARKLRLFRDHGIDRDFRARESAGAWEYEMVALGYNYRLSDIGCALGASQLARLDRKLSRRREIVRRYGCALADLPGLRLPVERDGVRSAWHLYPVRLEPEQLHADRAAIFAALRAENIGVNVHYVPVHYHPYYRDRFGEQRGRFPVAEAAYRTLVTLPLFESMTEKDVEDVITAVEKVLRRYTGGNS